MDDTLPAREHTVVGRLVERTSFARRWLTPFYVGLIVSLLVLLLPTTERQ